MTTLGNHLDRLAIDGNGTAWYGDAGSRFECNVRHNRLARRNTTQNATGMVAQESFRRHFIAVLGTTLGHTGKTVTNLYTFHRIDAHQRVGQFGIQTVKNRLAQTRQYALGHNRDFRTDRILITTQLVHISFQLGHFICTGAKECVVIDLIP